MVTKVFSGIYSLKTDVFGGQGVLRMHSQISSLKSIFTLKYIVYWLTPISNSSAQFGCVPIKPRYYRGTFMGTAPFG